MVFSSSEKIFHNTFLIDSGSFLRCSHFCFLDTSDFFLSVLSLFTSLHTSFIFCNISSSNKSILGFIFFEEIKRFIYKCESSGFSTAKNSLETVRNHTVCCRFVHPRQLFLQFGFRCSWTIRVKYIYYHLFPA